MSRLMLGDCLRLMHEIEDQSVDLVLCDLPYGTTRNKWDSVIPLDELWLHYKRLSRGPIVLTAQTPFDKALGASNLPMLRYEWIWEKEQGTGQLNAKRAPMKVHENILVFCERQTPYNPQMRPGAPYFKKNSGDLLERNYGRYRDTEKKSEGGRYPLSVLKFRRERGLHPTQKPVPLMEYLIRTYTSPGDVVLDNCMGSGTTGVACRLSGRRFIGIESNPEFFAVAERRIRSTLVPSASREGDEP